jgi:hypothetical protein
MASATSASSGKRARASSVSTAHLLLSVGAIASGGREGFDGGGGKEGFWCPWRRALARFIGPPAPAGNVGGRTGTAGGKHWPARPTKFLAATVARARILRRAPCLHRQDLHAGVVGNKCVGPLGCPPPSQTDLILVFAARTKRTDSDTKMGRPAGDAFRPSLAGDANQRPRFFGWVGRRIEFESA